MSTEAPRKRGRPRKVAIEVSAPTSNELPSTSTPAKPKLDLDVPSSKTKAIKKSTKKANTTPKSATVKPTKSVSRSKSKAKVSAEVDPKNSELDPTSFEIPLTIASPSEEQDSATPLTTVPASVSNAKVLRTQSLDSSSQAPGPGFVDQLQPTGSASRTAIGPTFSTKQHETVASELISRIQVHSVPTVCFDMPAIYRPFTLGCRPTLLVDQPTAFLQVSRPLSTEQLSSKGRNADTRPSQRISTTDHSSPTGSIAPKRPPPHRQELKYNPPPRAGTPAQPRQSTLPTTMSSKNPSAEPLASTSQTPLPGLGKHLTYKGASRR